MSNGEETEQGPVEGDVQEEKSPTLEEELAEATREKDQFRLMALRAQADLENYRKRAGEEREEARRSANTAILLRVLSVIDDFERAMALVPDDAVAPGWLEGLQLVHKSMFSAAGVRGRQQDRGDRQHVRPTRVRGRAVPGVHVRGGRRGDQRHTRGIQAA